MIEKVEFGGWPNCIRLFNNEIEVVVTTDIGPRIVKLGYITGQNFFYLVPEHLGKAGGDDWRIYGGHRLWHAPEAIPRSYSPDNDTVEYLTGKDNVILTQVKEHTTGIVKVMEIEIASDRNEITVTHRIINRNLWTIQLAAWCLSVLAPGGKVILPQEPYGEGDDYLLPARPLVLWQYTKMNDPRWVWGEKYIQARHNPALTSEQKIGVLNKQGWITYARHGEVLTKKFGFNPQSDYTDYGCNNEIYINDKFIEIETLSPLAKLLPGEVLEHKEQWQLNRVHVGDNEEAIDGSVLPLLF